SAKRVSMTCSLQSGVAGADPLTIPAAGLGDGFPAGRACAPSGAPPSPESVPEGVAARDRDRPARKVVDPWLKDRDRDAASFPSPLRTPPTGPIARDESAPE